MGAVLGATALDVVTAQALPAQESTAQAAARHYRERSGFPMGVEASRGMARDFDAPRDMRTPEALRPPSLH